MAIYGGLNPPPDTPLDQTGESSMAQQQFKDESDINTIMSRYETTGYIEPGALNFRQQAFGDFAAFASFEDVEEALSRAHEAFMTLPAADREQYGNNVGTFVTWVSNPANLDAALERGYIIGPLGGYVGFANEPGVANPGKTSQVNPDPAAKKSFEDQVA